MPLDETGKPRETTPVERIKVIEARAAGNSFRQIEAMLPISKSQAQKISSEWTATDKIKTPRVAGILKSSQSAIRGFSIDLRKKTLRRHLQKSQLPQVLISWKGFLQTFYTMKAGIFILNARSHSLSHNKSKRGSYGVLVDDTGLWSDGGFAFSPMNVRYKLARGFNARKFEERLELNSHTKTAIWNLHSDLVDSQYNSGVLLHMATIHL